MPSMEHESRSNISNTFPHSLTFFQKYIKFVMYQDMVYSFGLVILVLVLISEYRKHRENMDWAFEGFTVVPIFWIFCCAFYLLNRKKQLKKIEFVSYTKKFTSLRKVVYLISALVSLMYSVLLIIQYFQVSQWKRAETIRLICFIGLSVAVSMIYLLLMTQNEKVSWLFNILETN